MIKPSAGYVSNIKKAIAKLPPKERVQLIDSLQRESWAQRFKQLLKRINARFAKHPLSAKELNKIIEDAREEYHAKGSR